MTKEQFKKECNVLRAVNEYPGYTGEEKWIIITDLNEDEFYKRYEAILSDFVPFILLKAETRDVFAEFTKSEDKFIKRKIRGDIAYEEGITEEAYYEYYKLIYGSTNLYGEYDDLYTAIENLSPEQKRRIIARYIEEYSLTEIADMENVSVPAVKKSIDLALAKLRQILKKF